MKIKQTYAVTVEHEDTLLNAEMLLMEAVDNYGPFNCASVTTVAKAEHSILEAIEGIRMLKGDELKAFQDALFDTAVEGLREFSPPLKEESVREYIRSKVKVQNSGNQQRDYEVLRNAIERELDAVSLEQPEDANNNRIGHGVIPCHYCGQMNCNFDCDIVMRWLRWLPRMLGFAMRKSRP